MKATKFKSVDIVEHEITGIVCMVDKCYEKYFTIVEFPNLKWSNFHQFKKLSYKDVKINLGNRTKINFETVTNGHYKIIPKKYVKEANSRLRKKKINLNK